MSPNCQGAKMQLPQLLQASRGLLKPSWQMAHKNLTVS